MSRVQCLKIIHSEILHVPILTNLNGPVKALFQTYSNHLIMTYIT